MGVIMEEYEIIVSGPTVATLKIDGNPLMIVNCGKERSIVFLDDISDIKYVNSFAPTSDFWNRLVDIDKFTSILADDIGHIRYQESIPDLEHWGILSFSEVPKYENRILREMQISLLYSRVRKENFFEDDKMKNLFGKAYEKENTSVPFYLE